ncbi:MAG: glycoside hydrolase family 28 protein [Syntrophothermus sp.]
MKKRPGHFSVFRTLNISLIIFLTGFASLYAQTITQEEVNSYIKGLPFDMPQIKLPSFASGTFDITKYGAVSDGITKNTEAIQKAIDECSSKGGMVIIPSGQWLTGPITLKSNVNLHLEAGALVVFSSDFNDYPLTKYKGSSSYTCAYPIYADGAENIAITGNGLFNGSGQIWRPVKKAKMNESQWKMLLKSDGVLNDKKDMWWPTEKAAKAEDFLKGKSVKELTLEDFESIKDYYRPHMVYLNNCKNVYFDGPTFQNSPKFAVYITKSENMVINNVKINNEWFAQNGDGIDISACRNVLVSRCTVNAGDDGICMKSSTLKNVSGPALKNIVVADCIVYHAHGGFVIGSNTDGGMENIYVSNCSFVWTETGLRFKSGRGRGGLVEKVFINNIHMKDIEKEAVTFDLYYEDAGAAKTKNQKEENKLPVFQNITIDRVVCDGAEEALNINGLPGFNVRNIMLSNSVFNTEKGIESTEAEGIKIDNVVFNSKAPELFFLKNSRNFVLNSVKFNPNITSFMKLSGDRTSGIQIRNTKTGLLKTPFEFVDGADSKSVISE